jgi:DNA-directed RNA polymerase subunit E"
MSKKVCKECKIFVEENQCPICKGNNFTTNWQGKINILDVNKSIIAHKMDIKVKGEYAIKAK